MKNRNNWESKRVFKDFKGLKWENQQVNYNNYTVNLNIPPPDYETDDLRRAST